MTLKLETHFITLSHNPDQIFQTFEYIKNGQVEMMTYQSFVDFCANVLYGMNKGVSKIETGLCLLEREGVISQQYTFEDSQSSLNYFYDPTNRQIILVHVDSTKLVRIVIRRPFECLVALNRSLQKRLSRDKSLIPTEFATELTLEDRMHITMFLGLNGFENITGIEGILVDAGVIQ